MIYSAGTYEPNFVLPQYPYTDRTEPYYDAESCHKQKAESHYLRYLTSSSLYETHEYSKGRAVSILVAFSFLLKADRLPQP